jgi:hypothetical protein
LENHQRREKKGKYKRVFKDEWVPQFLWVEHGGSCKEYMVCYKVFSLVEGKEKLLNLKLDGL